MDLKAAQLPQQAKPSPSFWSTKCCLICRREGWNYNSTLVTEREIHDKTHKRRNTAGALALPHWKFICGVCPRSSICRTLQVKIYWQLLPRRANMCWGTASPWAGTGQRHHCSSLDMKRTLGYFYITWWDLSHPVLALNPVLTPQHTLDSHNI